MGKLREGLARYDQKVTGLLSQRDFAGALGAAGLFLSEQDISVLMRFLKSQEDPSKIGVQSFLNVVRGDGLPPRRFAMVESVWNRLDKRGSGSVPLQEVLSAFDPSKHPRVGNCEMSREEVTERLEADLRELGAGEMVSQKVFFLYFEELSACIPPEKEFFFDQAAGECFCPPNALSVPLERLEQLARFLCEKFRQLSPTEDILKVVYAKFHHQDKGGTGGLGLEEFGHLLISTGMNLPQHEKQAFFDFLAAPCGGGRIEFKSFSSLLRKISEIPPLPDTNAEDQGDSLEPAGPGHAPLGLIAKIKKHMVRYHPQGVNCIFLVYRRLDQQKRGYISHTDFYSGLKQCGLRLGTEEVESLLNFFDFNRDGKVTYEQFLDLVRGPVAKSRIEACQALWAKLTPADSVAAKTLSDFYSPDMHPEVLSGKATAEKKREEFLEYCGEYLLLGQVPKDVVLNYFVDEGVSIAADQDFQQYLETAFPNASA